MEDAVEDMKYYFQAVQDSVRSHGLKGCVLLGLVTDDAGQAIGHCALPKGWSPEQRLKFFEDFTSIMKKQLEAQGIFPSSVPEKQ